jgi:flagellar basal body rod protein FlgC
MRIESSFGLVDTAISAMQKQAESMRIITSSDGNARRAVPDIAGTESGIGVDAGLGSRGSRVNLDLLPVQMTNLDIAVQTYEINVGVLGRYKQMTETTLGLLG